MERQRLGINLVSLMTALWGEGRLSIRTIQWYLKTMYGWKLSTGGIVGATHGVARQAEPAVAEVLDLMRARWCTPTKPDGARTWKTAMSGPTALPPDGANPGQTVHPVGRRADGRGRHWQQATAARYPVMSDADLMDVVFPTSRRTRVRNLVGEARQALKNLERSGELRIIQDRVLPPLKPAPRRAE